MGPNDLMERGMEEDEARKRTFPSPKKFQGKDCLASPYPKEQRVAKGNIRNPTGHSANPQGISGPGRCVQQKGMLCAPPTLTAPLTVQSRSYQEQSSPNPRFGVMTPREMKELRKYIVHRPSQGIHPPAKSCIVATAVFKEKKDGTMRLCIDFRRTNAVYVENMYPLPQIKDMLAHLMKGKIFTKLNLMEAYYRVRIKERDEWKIVFNCPLESFQVMPFVLQRAPVVFMQLMNEVLHDHLYKGVLVYLDNIFIFTETIGEGSPPDTQPLAANLYV